jgi:hypothetical protein
VERFGFDCLNVFPKFPERRRHHLEQAGTGPLFELFQIAMRFDRPDQNA